MRKSACGRKGVACSERNSDQVKGTNKKKRPKSDHETTPENTRQRQRSTFRSEAMVKGGVVVWCYNTLSSPFTPDLSDPTKPKPKIKK